MIITLTQIENRLIKIVIQKLVYQICRNMLKEIKVGRKILREYHT